MKRLILLLILSSYLFAFEGQIAKILIKTFTKTTITQVSKKYGSKGIEALATLTKRYGKNGLSKLNEINKKFGQKGIDILIKYGELPLKNQSTFKLVNQYGSKGFYLLKRYPNKSIEYYNKFGNKFVTNADKYGNKRVIKYLDDAKKYNQDTKVMTFLDKFGDKANSFLDKHWGKLLTSGFVLLNADSLIASTQNIAESAINKGGDVVTDSVSNISNSQVGLFMGIAILLFVFFKFGIDKLIAIREKKKNV